MASWSHLQRLLLPAKACEQRNLRAVSAGHCSPCFTTAQTQLLTPQDPPAAQEGCRKRPGYNFPGESTTGKYCSQHKLEGMVDVKHKPCQYENCTKRPYFNYQGETHGILCNEHKQPGMINVGQAPCAEPGCHLAPSFNFPGQKKRLFCAQHKLEGMVNISQQPRSQLVGP